MQPTTNDKILRSIISPSFQVVLFIIQLKVIVIENALSTTITFNCKINKTIRNDVLKKFL